MTEPRDGAASEVFRFGGAGTVLLVSLLAFIGLQPLFLSDTALRIAGGLVLAAILVSGTIAASRSFVHRVISGALAICALGLQLTWLFSGAPLAAMALMVMFSTFCIYTAILILRRVLSFGPLYADRVHAALSVYVLVALFWAGLYTLIELVWPGSFSIGDPAQNGQAGREAKDLLAQMMHFSIATLTSTGYGDITAIAPLARSLSQLEQLIGIFYMAVLISRLIGLYPDSKSK